MTVATTILFVRHGTHGHLGRTMSGRTPGISLNTVGRDEAKLVATRFAGDHADALYSSPLERARETAEPIAAALGHEVRIAEGLNEIEMGEWTGASFETLHADERWHRWNRERASGCPPGGEPMQALQDRVVALLEAWRTEHPDGRVVAVSHADVIKVAVCHYLGLSLDRYWAFDVEPASITTVVAWDGGGKVAGLNERVRP